MNNIQKRLFENQDLKFKDFFSKLIPNILKENVIGVRTPLLKKIAKELTEEEKLSFINELPHRYVEENTLHALIVDTISNDLNEIFDYLDEFLPYVDNWATCDTMHFKIFSKNKKEVFCKIKTWLKSKDTYTVRFGIDMLLTHFIDDEYVQSANSLLLKLKSDEYYINMAIAWYYSFALIKQYSKTIEIFENRLLDKWIHNKSLQKAIESYRIPNETKNYLRSLKIK